VSQQPHDLNDLDALLRAVRFEPRASLGAELAGRFRQPSAGLPAVPRVLRLRQMLGVTGMVALLGIGLFAFWRLALRPVGFRVVDRCCQDLDGGGDPDDGLVIVPAAGKAVARLAIYEDRDGSRSYTLGDSLRFERRGAPTVGGALGVGPLTRELCCLDYDGEGASDDALLVVGVPPDQISLAAIYERGRGPARLR
jgi:hypothetical protein